MLSFCAPNKIPGCCVQTGICISKHLGVNGGTNQSRNPSSMSMFFPGLILLAASNTVVASPQAPNISCAYLSALAGEALSAHLDGQSKTEADERLEAMQSDSGLSHAPTARMRHDLIDHAYAYFGSLQISEDPYLHERYIERVAGTCARRHRNRHAQPRQAVYGLR